VARGRLSGPVDDRSDVDIRGPHRMKDNIHSAQDANCGRRTFHSWATLAKPCVDGHSAHRLLYLLDDLCQGTPLTACLFDMRNYTLKSRAKQVPTQAA